MAYREVSVIEIREVLRLWVGGEGFRAVERLTTVDRKTVRRYVSAATELGLERDGEADQITDVLVAGVVDAVRPQRPGGHGAAWEACEANREVLVKWLQTQGLTVVKAHQLLERQGVVVPPRTLYRFAAQELGVGRPETTVRVADCEPGSELQVDFGRMGLIADPVSGRRRVCQALVFTPAFSRYSFVWLTHSQTLASVVVGFEAAPSVCSRGVRHGGFGWFDRVDHPGRERSAERQRDRRGHRDPPGPAARCRESRQDRRLPRSAGVPLFDDVPHRRPAPGVDAREPGQRQGSKSDHGGCRHSRMGENRARQDAVHHVKDSTHMSDSGRHGQAQRRPDTRPRLASRRAEATSGRQVVRSARTESATPSPTLRMVLATASE